MRRPVPLCVIAALLLAPVVAGAAGLSVLIDGRSAVFSDVPEDAWYATHVRQAAEAGIVSGYRDAAGNLTGKFGPGDPVEIAQALKIAVEGAGYDVTTYETNEQCGMGMHWAAGYVCVAVVEKFVLFRVGIDPGIYLDRPTTRAEVAQIIVAAFRLDDWAGDMESLKDYIDVDSTHPYARAINKLTINDIMMGDGRSVVMVGNNVRKVQCVAPIFNSLGECPKTTFRPDDHINRAETVKIVMRAREVYGEPGDQEGYIEESGETSNIITYTNEGFSPSVLHVEKGAKVFFRNESSGQMWVASDPHPDHTNLEFLDAGRGYDPDETYEFDFLHPGSWGFHNHMSPQHRGTIIVE